MKSTVFEYHTDIVDVFNRAKINFVLIFESAAAGVHFRVFPQKCSAAGGSAACREPLTAHNAESSRQTLVIFSSTEPSKQRSHPPKRRCRWQHSEQVR